MAKSTLTLNHPPSCIFAIIRGPNQGHYVAVVKHEGRWLLYDDENVEPVDEADIPRYFGDYPAGAGYVLFYQAADLDPVALGLEKVRHPPVPPVVNETAVVAQPSPLPVSSSSTMTTTTTATQTQSTPEFTNVPMLEAEPLGAVAAAMSPQSKVEAALAEYQSSLQNPSTSATSASSSGALFSHGKASEARDIPTRSVRPGRPTTAPSALSLSQANGGGSTEETADSLMGGGSGHEDQPSSTLDYDQGLSSPKIERSSSRWIPKFGGSKDGKSSKRNSFYGASSSNNSQHRPASSSAVLSPSSGTSAGNHGSWLGSNGTEGKPRRPSNSDKATTTTVSSAANSTLGYSPPQSTQALPGQASTRNHGPLRDSANHYQTNMSSSYISTGGSSDGGGGGGGGTSTTSSSMPQQGFTPSLASSTSSRPHLTTSSTLSSLATLGRSSGPSKKDPAPVAAAPAAPATSSSSTQPQKDRSTSGSSLSRRLSMNVPGALTRSSSAAFKSMLGGKKKDKD